MTDLKWMLLYLLSVSCCMSWVAGESFLVRIMSGGRGVSLGKMSTPFFDQFVGYGFGIELLINSCA